MRLSIGLIPALTLFALTLTLLGPVQAGWRANHAKSTRDTIHDVDIRVERLERTVHHGPRRNDRYARHRRSVEKRERHDVLVEKEHQKGGGREDMGLERRATEGACALGAWRCYGQELQRCFNGGYNKIQVCDGQKTICAADNPSTPPGCIWANAGVQMVGPSAPVPVPVPNPSIGPTSVYHPPVVNPSPSAILPPVVVPSPSGGGQLRPVVPSPSGVIPPSPSGSVPSPSGQGSPGPVVSGTPPTKEYVAPHWVAYLDLVHTPMPSAAQLLPANRFVLAFWLTQCPDTGTFGPYDWSKKWLDMPLSERTAVLEDYHSNGIALMVTAFGSTDFPMALDVDPVQCAVELAKYVKQAGLDGVDVDYEDSGSIQAGGGEAWLITFQTELRRQLPKPYIISHAPQPLYFLESWAPKGGYKTVHAAVGSGIDFYNVQYYNQGTSYPYTDCASMLTAGFQATSASEISQSAGVPMNKMVIGKPLLPKYVYNTGMMEGPAFGQCMKQGLGLGVGGAMIWQWDVGGQEFMKAVVGSGSNSTA